MIGFATSFNKEIFNISGFRLLKTYSTYQMNSKMFVGYEDIDFNGISNRSNVIGFDIYTTHLESWIKDNKDIIPIIFGGEADEKECNCKQIHKKYRKFNNHIGHCPFSYYNFRASLWFRKLVTLKWVIDFYEELDYLFWIDSDCFFKKALDEQYVSNIFNNSNIIYSCGPAVRKEHNAAETGFIGFKRPFDFITLWYDYYISGKFREEPRWDDSWTFTRFSEKYPEFKFKDLVENTKHPGSDVIRYGPFSNYIEHYKGIHIEKQGLPNDYYSISDEIGLNKSKKKDRYKNVRTKYNS